MSKLKIGSKVKVHFDFSNTTFTGKVVGLTEKRVGVLLSDGDDWTGMRDGSGESRIVA